MASKRTYFFRLEEAGTTTMVMRAYVKHTVAGTTRVVQVDCCNILYIKPYILEQIGGYNPQIGLTPYILRLVE